MKCRFCPHFHNEPYYNKCDVLGIEYFKEFVHHDCDIVDSEGVSLLPQEKEEVHDIGE